MQLKITDGFFRKMERFFTYKEGYSEASQNKKVYFTLDIALDNGVLTGSCFDEEVSPNMEGIITVTGFIEDNFISFIKQYPSYYEETPDGTIAINASKKHPEIHYSGAYNETSDSFEGIWEIEEPDNTNPFYYVYISSGSWQIERTE